MSTITETKLLKDLRVADLKTELEKRGQVTSGVKAVLVERLQSLLKDDGLDPETYDFNASCSDGTIEEAKEENDAANQEDNNGQSVNEAGSEMIESNKDEQEVEQEESSRNGIEDGNKDEDDSINIMLDEGEDFDEKDKDDNSLANTLPKTASPPRPETAPVVQPFTSRDTISLATLNKAPSENSSMRVAVDESESVGTQESLDGKDEASKGQANGEPEEKPLGSSSKVESNNSRNLWVMGISSSVRAADLKAAFAKLGKVNNAKVVSGSRSPGARVYGYVTMNSAEEAVKCLELNKTELNGKIITVERAKPDCIGPPKISSSQERTIAKEGGEHARKASSKDKEDQTKASTSKEGKLEDKKDGGSRSSRDRGRDHHRDHRDHRHSSKDHHRSRSPIRFPKTPPPRSSSTSSSFAATAAAAPEAGTAATESSAPSSSSSKRPIRERLSFRSPERIDKPPKPGVLTFAQIREERERERAREEERRRRQRERDRREEEDRRQRELERKRRAEEETIRREREELRREREKIEREKAELMRLERERQRLERERLQREKEELERLRRQQTSRIEDARRGTKRGSSSMQDDPYYDHDRSKRSSSGSAAAASRYEHSSSRYADQDRRYPADQDHRSRYPSSAPSSSSRGDYHHHHHHHHRDPGPPRGSTSDRDRGNSSRQPWGAPPGPPSGGGGGPGPSSGSSNNKPPYPPLMGSGSGGDWGSGGRSSGGPQPPQPPILSGGPNVPSFGNSGAPSSSGMGYGSRGGGGGGSQYSSGSGGGDRFNSYKPGGPMMGGGLRY